MAFSNPNIYQKVSFTIISVAYSFLVLWLALFMAGGGHGWNSSFWASTLIIISLPIASFAWLHRKTIKGKKYSIIAVLTALTANVLLISLTYFEGFENAFSPFQYDINGKIGSLIFTWYILWCLWQVFTVTIFGINLKQSGV